LHARAPDCRYVLFFFFFFSLSLFQMRDVLAVVI
jgi:hypothetical protein